jgi:UDP-N-acetylglucosamine--N-acetylmuramyl-(pentapeptide) pyrophosphoryl-undecaprenol N-acetylglucosamine transferase
MKEKKFMDQQRHKRVIISGGGTGGHIFPAISVASALRRIDPEIEILFVGAEGRMEMEKVPAAGFRIVGLPVAGFYRNFTFKNIKVILKLFKSLTLAGRIIREFNPDVVVGVGGYASGPVLWQAGKSGIPTLIQEQNSYAGLTNKILAKRASKICVAYNGMEKYFPVGKIIKTGNPVRQNYGDLISIKEEAYSYFNLSKESPVILILGGSLGAGTINKSLSANINKLQSSECQWLWQTGVLYFENVEALISATKGHNVSVHGFINRMDYAYAVSDIIISRAGAGTISELCLVGKPAILVPSPNVAEDHQTRNAMALSENEAAILIPDNLAMEKLVDEAINLVADESKKGRLSRNISGMADRNSDIRIAEEVLKLAN